MDCFQNRKSWSFKENTRFGFIFKVLVHQLFSQVLINSLAILPLLLPSPQIYFPLAISCNPRTNPSHHT